MHKLVILIEPPEDYDAFEEIWPQFLHLAERMPGLRRESTSRIDGILYGRYDCTIIHELYFDSLSDIQAAMGSPEGRATGELLQKMTGGHMTLLYADHKEDNLENILKFKKQEANARDEDSGTE
ncbi:MAG TPA: EthD family reductase [Anaerolineales bacterium]|jgi:uncharacterized protein (TIGR02118 family)|nr:EthD family reductase [Anaerolineales bacterium]